MRNGSWRLWPKRRLLLAASSALLLCGCASGDRLARFSAGDAPLDRQLPVECEAFLVKVPEPKVTARTDARVADVKDYGALVEANARLGAGADCARDQRQDYAGKGNPK